MNKRLAAGAVASMSSIMRCRLLTSRRVFSCFFHVETIIFFNKVKYMTKKESVVNAALVAGAVAILVGGLLINLFGGF